MLWLCYTISMKYTDVVEESKVNQAIADEIVETARTKRREQQTMKLIKRIAKLIIFVMVVGWALFLAWPFISGREWRDRARVETVDSIVSLIESYRTTHNGNLPRENSRKQWQNEFIKTHLDGKDFMKNPSKNEGETATYAVEVNYKKSNRDILNGVFGVVYIDQSVRCDKNNDITDRAGSSVAAVRLKLESGKIYCKNNG